MMLTLEAARRNANLTQAQAAKKLGVSKDTVGNWEARRSFPNALHILRIEQVYGIRFNNLLFLPQNNA